MNAPKNTLRLPIPDDACAKARELLAEGVDPNTVLEFVRRDTLWVPCDVVCLRGTVRAFASRMVVETGNGPVHVPYRPFDAGAKARVSKAVAPPMR
jgi:hypothetical protein